MGRLLAAVDGSYWLDKRNIAMIALMVRAGLRVSEVGEPVQNKSPV
jgi:site-specific recombinase XerD